MVCRRWHPRCRKLNKATVRATQANLKRFFQWLADRQGYMSL